MALLRKNAARIEVALPQFCETFSGRKCRVTLNVELGRSLIAASSDSFGSFHSQQEKLRFAAVVTSVPQHLRADSAVLFE